MQDFGHQLYRARKDGEKAAVARLLKGATLEELGGAAEASIARPLHSAVLSERLEFLESALAAGAPVNAVETNPKTSVYGLAALEVALWFDCADMAKTLVEH